MNTALAFYMMIISGFKNLLYGLENIEFLLTAIVVLMVLDMILRHTNIKTWLAKAKWGVGVALRGLDRFVLALVDNRDK